ncbi:hypothetical protein C1631_000090 [Chryseobacterium phosphatilyticum]|uniref:Uncharacterized protein n=1 Tax=Chryseobacterium phosphatilyticum TaxID=475075 RepID=A0A316XB75_9FLAO|nr:hypothetical protein C1631_000090 [Chryseobacterium phosphatilyticum]
MHPVIGFSTGSFNIQKYPPLYSCDLVFISPAFHEELICRTSLFSADVREKTIAVGGLLIRYWCALHQYLSGSCSGFRNL